MDVTTIIAILVLICFFVVIIFFIKSLKNAESSEPEKPTANVPANRGGLANRRMVVRGGVRSRMRQRLRGDDNEDNDEGGNDRDDDDGEVDEENEMDELEVLKETGKIGAKKMKKLEEKAEKKAQREAMEQERKDRKAREELREEERKKMEMRRMLEEQELAAREEQLRQEKKKREQEEYERMKEMFSVEEEGTDALEEQEAQNLLQEFVNYIKKTKVVMLEDLASKFQIKTQDAIDRVKTLQSDGILTGVMDDRGKFIYITQDEYEAVAKFINQRGRVSISELSESINQLINLDSSVIETPVSA